MWRVDLLRFRIHKMSLISAIPISDKPGVTPLLLVALSVEYIEIFQGHSFTHGGLNLGRLQKEPRIIKGHNHLIQWLDIIPISSVAVHQYFSTSFQELQPKQLLF